MEVDVINYKNDPKTASYVYFSASKRIYKMTNNGAVLWKNL